MAIVYISGTVQIYGLDISDKEALDELCEKVKRAILDIHPRASFDSDVEFSIDEVAGSFEQ